MNNERIQKHIFLVNFISVFGIFSTILPLYSKYITYATGNINIGRIASNGNMKHNEHDKLHDNAI